MNHVDYVELLLFKLNWRTRETVQLHLHSTTFSHYLLNLVPDYLNNCSNANIINNRFIQAQLVDQAGQRVALQVMWHQRLVRGAGEKEGSSNSVNKNNILLSGIITLLRLDILKLKKTKGKTHMSAISRRQKTTITNFFMMSDHITKIQKETNQIKSNQIKSNQIKSNQIKYNQIKSNQIKSNQI